MLTSSSRGESLIELIVALVILEIIGAAALAGALAAERIGRHAEQGAQTDVARWEAYRAAELAPACINAITPDSLPLLFPATADRTALEARVRCGR